MLITQYNSNNYLTPEFNCAPFKKRNNLDELIKIKTKAEEIRKKSMIQISFRTQDPNIKTGTILNLHQNSQLIHDPLCFQNPRIRSINPQNPQPLCFLTPHPSIRKPIHRPQNSFVTDLRATKACNGKFVIIIKLLLLPMYY